MFVLKLSSNIKYYYDETQNQVNKYYEELNDIQSQYEKKTIEILEKGFYHELVCIKSITGYEKFNKYKHIISDTNIYRYLNDKKIETILKYQNICGGFCEMYELVYNHGFDKLIKNDSRILEINNVTTFFEAINVYLENKKINIKNMQFNIISPNVHMTDDYIKKVGMVCEKFKISRTDTEMYKLIQFDEKYDMILLEVRKRSIYARSPLWIHNDNKIKIYYLLLSLLNLKKHGNIIMHFGWLRSYVQRDIFYLFKKIFKNVELYIPECSFFLASSNGFIIGKSYLNNINDNTIITFLEELSNVNDDKYHEFPTFLKNLKSTGPINFSIKEEKTNKTSKWIKSFINIPPKKSYDDQLSKYFINYYNEIIKRFDAIKINIKYPEDELLNKLKVGIDWAKKYGLDLNFSCDTNVLNYDFERYVIYSIYKRREFSIININEPINIITNDDTYNTDIDKLIDKYKDYIHTKQHVETVNPHIYIKIVGELYPYMDIYKNFIISIKEKYLTNSWLVFYEIFNFYNIINFDDSSKSIYIDATNKKVISSAINYYIRTNFREFDKYHTNKYNLVIINRKKKLMDSINFISKNKTNAILRISLDQLNNNTIIETICKILKCYKKSYFHKSELDKTNRIYLILLDYDENNKYDKNNIVKKIFFHACFKMINFLIDDEIAKLYMITRYDAIDKDKSSIELINDFKKRKIDRYREIFMIARFQSF